ncbi:MAG: hypothetical protein ACYC7A_22735 [Thermoanaerobaculia bacterium]
MNDNRRDRILSWAVAIVASAYVIWSVVSLGQRVPAFAQLFAGLGAEIPIPTRAVLAVCTPRILWPLGIFLVAVLVAKEFSRTSAGTKIAISVVIFMLVALFGSVATELIFRPMVSLMQQLG